MSIIIPLLPYTWSRERPDLQWRVIVALLLLLATKFATLAIPLLFKLVTDALAGFEGRRRRDCPGWGGWWAAPVPSWSRIALPASRNRRSRSCATACLARWRCMRCAGLQCGPCAFA